MASFFKLKFMIHQKKGTAFDQCNKFFETIVKNFGTVNGVNTNFK